MWKSTHTLLAILSFCGWSILDSVCLYNSSTRVVLLGFILRAYFILLITQTDNHQWIELILILLSVTILLNQQSVAILLLHHSMLLLIWWRHSHVRVALIIAAWAKWLCLSFEVTALFHVVSQSHILFVNLLVLLLLKSKVLVSRRKSLLFLRIFWILLLVFLDQFFVLLLLDEELL